MIISCLILKQNLGDEKQTRYGFINQIMSDLSGPGLVLPDFTLRTQTGTLLLLNVKILLVSMCCSVFSCDPESIAR